MVEVDVFWSYGIGASFALAAFRQIRKLEAEKLRAPEPAALPELPELQLNRQQRRGLSRLVKEIESGDTAFNNEYFMKTLLFLSLLFVPSGSNLLWSNPNWETMQVGSYETMPGWLVSGFTITNVTQGILGYWVTRNLLVQGKYYQAAQQTVFAYLGFWFILVNGWDKQGYRRFFSKNREVFDDWKWTNVFGWLTSDVVRILVAYGAVFIPLMLYWMTKWLEEGYEMDDAVSYPEDQAERMAEKVKLTGNLLATVFGMGLGGAVVSHLLIRWFGWVIGGTLASAVIYLGGLSKWGLGPRLLKKILKVEALEGPPVCGLNAPRTAD